MVLKMKRYLVVWYLGMWGSRNRLPSPNHHDRQSPWCTEICMFHSLPPASEANGEGNVFSRVCHSIDSEGLDKADTTIPNVSGDANSIDTSVHYNSQILHSMSCGQYRMQDLVEGPPEMFTEIWWWHQREVNKYRSGSRALIFLSGKYAFFHSSSHLFQNFQLTFVETLFKKYILLNKILVTVKGKFPMS